MSYLLYKCKYVYMFMIFMLRLCFRFVGVCVHTFGTCADIGICIILTCEGSDFYADGCRLNAAGIRAVVEFVEGTAEGTAEAE